MENKNILEDFISSSKINEKPILEITKDKLDEIFLVDKDDRIAVTDLNTELKPLTIRFDKKILKVKNNELISELGLQRIFSSICLCVGNLLTTYKLKNIQIDLYINKDKNTAFISYMMANNVLVSMETLLLFIAQIRLLLEKSNINIEFYSLPYIIMTKEAMKDVGLFDNCYVRNYSEYNDHIIYRE